MNNALTKKRNILLLYITKVSGHRMATMAIQRSLRQLDPGVDVPSINGFGYTFPVLEKVINAAYMGVIRRTPRIWDYMYDNPKIVRHSVWIKNFLHRNSHAKLTRLYEKYTPEAVVCTQAFPCGMMADFKRTFHKDFSLIGVLTDFAPHSFWINEGVDYYVVPCHEAKERFVAKGVPADKIKAYGIPIRLKFATQLDKQPIARKLGLDLNLPVILIMGGGQGLGPIKETVTALEKLPVPLQMIVITGFNKNLVKWLQAEAPRSSQKILFYEYANRVDELMEVATMIVTKPGGMTSAECLAKGLPMVIVNPLPGQEMHNTDFLLRKGIALRVDDPGHIAEEIELLLKSPDRLNAMRKAAFESSKPYAALDIAKLILCKQDGDQPDPLPVDEVTLQDV